MAMNANDQNPSYVHSSHLITTSNLGFLLNGNALNNVGETLNNFAPPSLLNYRREMQNDYAQSLVNFSDANKINETKICTYPQEYMSSFSQRESLETLPSYNVMGNACNGLSLLDLNEKFSKGLSHGDQVGECSNGSSVGNYLGKDEPAVNQVQNSKNDIGVRRRARRKRPFRAFGERSSQYRGVSRYRYTGRYEAFLWDNTNPNKKAKTVYVGVFDEEEEAARAFDLAALKFWGKSSTTNFPIKNYQKDLEEMQNMNKKDYLLSIRRKSKCFSKGASIYRGVSRNTDCTKWQARVGRGCGLRGIYLGTFEKEEDAARAYDIALISFKRMKAVTNFELSQYDVKAIINSSTLPIGKGASRLLKRTSVKDVISRRKRGMNPSSSSSPPPKSVNSSSNGINASYGEAWRVESTTDTTFGTNQNALFYDQICKQLGHQYDFQRQNQSGMNPTGLVSQIPITDHQVSGSEFWNGILESQTHGEDQSFHGRGGYGFQTPDFRNIPDFEMLENSRLGDVNFGRKGICVNNNGSIADMEDSASSNGGMQLGFSDNQFQQFQSDQTFQFLNQGSYFCNPDFIPGGGENSDVVKNSNNHASSSSPRNGFGINGVGSEGSSSCRESEEAGRFGEQDFGSEVMNSPCSWMENLFKDADPPSYML